MTDDIVEPKPENIEPIAEKPALEINQAEQAVESPEIPATVPARQRTARNYSFLHRNPDTLETISVDGKEYLIPAAMGSTYWAILKICYERFGQQVYIPTLLAEAEKLMLDSGRKESWEAYCNKGETTVYSKTQKTRTTKKAAPWETRFVNNGKTLTRLGGESQYGKRLQERGHELRYKMDAKGQPYFILQNSKPVDAAPTS